MKIRETRLCPAGFNFGAPQVRVRTLDEGEELPEGAVEVPDDTPETDWKNEEN